MIITIYIYIRADAFEPSLRKIRLMKIHCSEPEGGGGGRGGQFSVGPPSVRQRNAI